MAKDIEKLEKQNQKLKKKNKTGGKVIIVLLLIIAVLAAVLFFLDPFGWGIGPNAGKNGGGSSADSTPAAAANSSDTAEVTEAEPTVTEYRVTVSGATYLLEDNTESTVEEIVAQFASLDSKTLVRIIDDSATQNAMETLKAALEAENIEYVIE
ncbi:MAG: hypothetical protein IK990_17285 [Ruminiclostridium sp.]|nr:hypothetical protein [Ruminiclostridium sp.]